MKNKFNYVNLFKIINIKKKDKIIINSNFLDSLIFFKKKKIDFSVKEFIDNLINYVGYEGTIVIPSYNWDFCKGVKFNQKKTGTYSGALSRYALQHKLFQRSSNPIYSFVVFGKFQKKIINLNHQDSFGKKSPFNFMIKNNFKNIFFNLSYREAFTFVHYVEQFCKVKYRYHKVFVGYCKYINKRIIKRKISMYVRSKNVKETKIKKTLDKELLRKNILIKKKYNFFKIEILNISQACRVMIDSIYKNKGYIYPEYER